MSTTSVVVCGRTAFFSCFGFFVSVTSRANFAGWLSFNNEPRVNVRRLPHWDTSATIVPVLSIVYQTLPLWPAIVFSLLRRCHCRRSLGISCPVTPYLSYPNFDVFVNVLA